MKIIDMWNTKKASVSAWEKALSLILIACLVSGCHTIQIIPPDSKSITETLRPGDLVRMTMRDGHAFNLRLKEITEHSITGEEEREQLYVETAPIALTDIAQIDRREFSHWKTAGLIVALGITAGLIITLMFPHGCCVGSLNSGN